MCPPYRGKCHCGAIDITITAEPLIIRQCWCRQCQKIAAGGATNNAVFPVEAITVTGALGSHSYTSASGNEINQLFCKTCGTPVMSMASVRPHLRTVRLGMLDCAHGLRPEMVIWTNDAPKWALIDPSLPTWPQQPPSPKALSS